jgi:hypothetical protein
MESLSSNFQYKGLNTPGTDNEDEDFPPEFTTLAHEQEKCEWNLVFKIYFHCFHRFFTISSQVESHR